MKIDIDKTVEITMILNEEEAEWLKRVCQNSLTADESFTDNEMREKFWTQLNYVI